jgi:hypothetical protein
MSAEIILSPAPSWPRQPLPNRAWLFMIDRVAPEATFKPPIMCDLAESSVSERQL